MVRPAPATHGSRPSNYRRPYDGSRSTVRPAHRTRDYRYARPSYRAVRPHPSAYNAPPLRTMYRPYYTRWYQHPWYRYSYSTTTVVNFGFGCDPWAPGWRPNYRSGWNWMPGVWVGSVWSPGWWAPVRTAPVGYMYVPGFWDGSVYVDGWYRPNNRTDGDWAWVEGYYLDDGTYVRGHWHPTKPGPAGYTWEPGFWDGETWIDGFWRPEYRSSFAWVSSFYDADGIYHGGYWAPLDQQAGFVWIPGWFDGNGWIEGYWVAETEYQSTDVTNWQPAEGWNDGWEVSGFGDGTIVNGGDVPQGAPLGLPVD